MRDLLRICRTRAYQSTPTFTGNIDTMGGIRIDGTVKGNVKAGGDVTVGSDGAIEGNVNAFNCNIAERSAAS
jgi:cytoskeletal protein CcmA (bactofilin family)